MVPESEITSGRALAQAGDLEAAIAHFQRLAVRYPDDGGVYYELASVLDGTSMERDAIPHYRQALHLGLAGADRAGALLGLGSSLRLVGKPEEAVVLLAAAVEEFPAHRSLKAFHVLAQVSAGTEVEVAMAQLKRLLVEGDLGVYEAAIRRYASEVLTSPP